MVVYELHMWGKRWSSDAAHANCRILIGLGLQERCPVFVADLASLVRYFEPHKECSGDSHHPAKQ